MKLVTQGHLGGYVEGGDPATYYPDLWQWVVRERQIRSVLDIGCGDGRSTTFFRDMQCRVLGVEGVAQDHPHIVQHDFVRGPYLPRDTYDLGWCCEFVEHVESRYLDHFLQTFAAVSNVLLMTHAFPGQDGHHHVNCQPSEYWIGHIEGIGFRYDPQLTAAARQRATVNTNPYNHFVRSGLAFTRC